MKILVMATRAMVRGLSKRTVTLRVPPTLTVVALKSLLEPHPWMPKENLLLVLRRGSFPLNDDGATLDQCGVKDRDTLLACMDGSFTLKILSSEIESFPILIGNCFEIVGEVKEKICREKGYAIEDLIIRRDTYVIHQDETPLVALGIVKPYLTQNPPYLSVKIPKLIRHSALRGSTYYTV